MGIRDKPTAPDSPWQNGFAERLIGSIRRECVDHVIALGEAHLRRILQAYARYYNDLRRTDRWTKMRHSRARFSESVASRHMRSSADCITTTCEPEFRYTQVALQSLSKAGQRTEKHPNEHTADYHE
jgi:hypothetical protein